MEINPIAGSREEIHLPNVAKERKPSEMFFLQEDGCSLIKFTKQYQKHMEVEKPLVHHEVIKSGRK